MLSINRTGHIWSHRSHFDSTAFSADFSAMDWDSQFENCNHNPNLCFNTFDLKVKALADRYLPTVRLTKRQCKTQLKPQITTGIVKAISKRDFFFRKFVQEKNPEIKAQFHTLFKTIEILL